MPTRRPFDHLGNSKFKIEIDGVTQGAFTAIDGLEATTEVIEFAEGSDTENRKRPGRTFYSNILLKRGYTNSDELWNWYKLVIDGKVERKNGSLIICAEDGSELARYNFFEAWPCRWKNFVMDARGRGTLIEELEVVVERMERA